MINFFRKFILILCVTALAVSGLNRPVSAGASSFASKKVKISSITKKSGSYYISWNPVYGARYYTLQCSPTRWFKKYKTVDIKVGTAMSLKLDKSVPKCFVRVRAVSYGNVAGKWSKKWNVKEKKPAKNYVKGLTQDTVKKRILKLKKKYPSETKWTNKKYYKWDALGDQVIHAHGCVAFACILSDAGFGKKADARVVNHPSWNKVKIGDIIRVENDTHSAIVIGKNKRGYVLAEGNLNNGIVWWGREMPKTEKIDYMWTRW